MIGVLIFNVTGSMNSKSFYKFIFRTADFIQLICFSFTGHKPLLPGTSEISQLELIIDLLGERFKVPVIELKLCLLKKFSR